MKYACQYAIIQFLPFVETGEFANVGIALLCPETGFLRLEVAGKEWRRMRDFFAPLERRIYVAAIDRLQEEQARVEALADALRTAGERKELWAELVRRRDGIIRFAPPRAVMSDDPTTMLAELYGRYVEHNFATPEYQERRLEQTVRGVLTGASLGKIYQKAALGDDYYRVTLPFVRKEDGRVTKAIKPLFLAQDEPTKILLHGGEWLERLRRLRKHAYLPEHVLIPVAAPGDRGRRDEAYDEICQDLQTADFQVIEIADASRIRTFAQ